MLVIGSYSLWLQGHDVRFSDIDLLMTWEQFLVWRQKHDVPVFPVSSQSFVGALRGHKLEVRIALPRTTDYELLTKGLAPEATHMKELAGFRALPFDWCYLLKLSHRFKKSPHFEKTRRHIQWFRRLGAQVPDKAFLIRRVKETLPNAPSLDQGKDEFFRTPGVTYTYDHDNLHKAVALGDRPAYTYYMSGDAEVLCSRVKWDLLPEQVRVNGVVEEAMVLALERSLIPFPGKLTADQAFRQGLEAICTTVTSGWFRRYAWENFDTIMAEYEANKTTTHNYKLRYMEGLATGVVTKLQPQGN